MQDAVSASGDGIVMDVNECNSATFQITGTFTATVTFEASLENSIWVAIPATNVTTQVSATTATAAGVYVANVVGLEYIRARVTWASGTSVTIFCVASSGALDTSISLLAVPAQVIKTVAATATPEALAADATYFQTAMIGGLKAARTNNVGTVYLGIGSTNDTQPLAITAGEWITVNAPVGQKFDLNDWYLDVLNAGDGVAVIYS